MGIGIKSLSILNGITTIENLYGHVRNIRVTKNDEGLFEINCDLFIYKDVGENRIQIKVTPIYKTYDNDFLTKTWNDVYTIIKEVLTNEGIEYVDQN